jgi:hypothetical protein
MVKELGLVEFTAQLVRYGMEEIVGIVLPPPLDCNGLEGVSDRAPSFFGRLEQVAIPQFIPGVVQEAAAELHVVISDGGFRSGY